MWKVEFCSSHCLSGDMAVILPIYLSVSVINARLSFRGHLHSRNFSKWNHKANAKLFLYLTSFLILSYPLLAVSRIPRGWKTPSFVCHSFYNVHFKYQFQKIWLLWCYQLSVTIAPASQVRQLLSEGVKVEQRISLWLQFWGASTL